MKLLHKDLVKLGRYEASQGYSLDKIEADFSKKGINRAETIKALEEVDYYNQLEKSKIQKETDKKIASEGKPNTQNKQAANEKNSSFWPWFVLLIIIGVILYLFFSGTINFDWLTIKKLINLPQN